MLFRTMKTTKKNCLSRKLLLGLAMGCLIQSAQLNAMPANPSPFFESQPDGNRVELRIKGDEHFNWLEDGKGYTVVKHQGWYRYASLKDDRLVPSAHVVGKASPEALGLQKHLLPSEAARSASAKTTSSQSSEPEMVAPTGNIKNMVIPIRFSDHAGRTVPSQSDIDILMNAPGGHATLAPTGSVRDVYLENSYGQMDLASDVQPWVTVSKTEAYYANGQSGDSTLWEALREALDEVDKSVDFRNYDTDGDGRIDAIAFLHSGYGAEWGGTDAYGTPYQSRIWSHRWAIQLPHWTSEEGIIVSDYHISPSVWGTSGSQIGRIGVIAHETGHFFGLPDLYDTNGGGEGIGSYGLMANSWDFSGSQLCPPHFSPWSKIQLGWYVPQDISATGTYYLDRTEQPQNSGYPEVYKISSGYPTGEYLLVENRQNAGFDCSLPQGGLAIWHIDEEASHTTEGYPGQIVRGRSWPNNGRHYQVALLQADGRYDLERGNNRGDSGDVFHGGAVNIIGPGPDTHPNTDTYQGGTVTQTGHELSSISASSDLMSFCLNCTVAPPPPPPPSGGFEAPTDLTAAVTREGRGKNATKSVTLFWADNTSEEDSFVIERCQETGSKKNKACNFAPYATVGADVTTYVDPETLTGTYKYRVQAHKSTGETTAYSNEVKI